MKITPLKHTEDHWNFLLEDGSEQHIGKYKIVDGKEEGVKTEADAIEIVRLNVPELEA